MNPHDTVDRPHGGLEALVAAANAHNHAMESPDTRSGSDIPSTNPMVQALATILRSNPELANWASQPQALLTALTAIPPHLTSMDQQGGASDTPFQQTRSGRISRPPAQPITDPSLDSLNDASGLGTAAMSQDDTTSGHTTVVETDFVQEPLAALAALSALPKATPGNLPAWPLPPTGPGGRKRMPKEEMLARRRARNKESASAHRKKKQAKIEAMDSRLQLKETEYEKLESRCRSLEQQIQQLQGIILSAGLSLPSGVNTPLPPTIPLPLSNNQFDLNMPHFDFSQLFPVPTPAATIATQAINHASVGSSAMDTTLAPFDMFTFLDMDGEEDAEFVPPTSPHESDDESRRKDKGKKRERGDDEDDDEFVDEEVEDEDLFLPIEDVPIPPADQMRSAMRSLGVDNQEELAKLINKMVNAGKEGMTSEMVEKLKVLVSLVGPNGVWAKDQKPGAGQL